MLKKELSQEELEKISGGKYYDTYDQVKWTRKVNDSIVINSILVGSVKQLGVLTGALGGYYPYIRVEFTDGIHQNGWYKDEETEFTEATHEYWIEYKL